MLDDLLAQDFKDACVGNFSVFEASEDLFWGAGELAIKHNGVHVLGRHPPENSPETRGKVDLCTLWSDMVKFARDAEEGGRGWWRKG